jgi:protein-S-isoprenylcysteine O-methyltransferase Ste14
MKRKAWIAVIALAAVMGLLLFPAAGTVRYWQGWLYLAVFFSMTAPITAYLLKNDPALLERRMSGGPTAEKERAQKIIMSVATLGFAGILVVSALDFRFQWSNVSPYAVIVGNLLTVLGFCITFLVYKENSFASATIEVVPGQRVISTGPYAFVRHPMYTGGMLYLLGMPLALGSWWGFVPLAAMLPALFWRISNEEQFLSTHLPGYSDYLAKVRWRMIPKVY